MISRLMPAALLALLAVSGCARGITTNSNTNTNTSVNPGFTKSQATLRENMRKLWTDHTVWTRVYIIAALDGAPDAQVASTRLLKNQEDIGAALVPYYGAAAGTKVTELLDEHILIAVDFIAAAKANDQAKLTQADTKWKANANAIADYLSAANPNRWPQATLREMLAEHLETTTAEVNARVRGNWAEDVRAYDAVYDHILNMSDALSDGIIAQFPDKFR